MQTMGLDGLEAGKPLCEFKLWRSGTGPGGIISSSPTDALLTSYKRDEL